MFKIRSDVPLPPPDFGGTNKERRPYIHYPFEEMEVGDSFLAIGISQAQLSNAAKGHRRHPDRTHKTFATRLDPNTNHPRVWRIS